MNRLIGLGIWALVLLWALFPGGSHAQTQELLLSYLDVFMLKPPVNPEFFVLFSFLGLWPLVMGAFLFSQEPVLGRFRWKLLVWILSFFGGAYALSPYLLFEKRSGALPAPRWLQSLSLSPFTALVLGLMGLGLGTWFVLGMDAGRLWGLIQSSSLMRTMAFDFLLFHSWALLLVWEDQRARGTQWARVWQMLFLIPFFGPVAYLGVRGFLSPSE